MSVDRPRCGSNMAIAGTSRYSDRGFRWNALVELLSNSGVTLEAVRFRYIVPEPAETGKERRSRRQERESGR